MSLPQSYCNSGHAGFISQAITARAYQPPAAKVDNNKTDSNMPGLSNKTNRPIIFLQNVTGFLVGKEFERDGIVKKGSQMINAVSNSTVPHITIILGASYGAGTYAMSGRAFNNRFTFLWPSAKIAVMGGKQIAGVMSMVR